LAFPGLVARGAFKGTLIMALLSLDCRGVRLEDRACGRLVGVAEFDSLRLRLWLFSRFLREAEETVAKIAVRMAAECIKHHRETEVKGTEQLQE
jgi:hypothetical protein